MKRNIYELALLAQSACNGSGLINDLAKTVLPEVWEEAKVLSQGTDYVNKHPVIYLFLHQLMFLAGNEPLGDKAMNRWDECMEICRAKAVEPVPA